jgi:8-oxo-dGTP pyrophosphatase MutT (NUDIX family)
VKTTTHGVLLLDASAELLLCHATGTRHWDIPKGLAEAGETSAAAACREAREECGLALEPAALQPVGHFRYRPDKDLALHAVLIERIDPSRCVCTSTFVDRFGRVRPEMDDFRWTPFDEIGARCAKNMALLLTTRVALPSILAQLVGARDRRDPNAPPS